MAQLTAGKHPERALRELPRFPIYAVCDNIRSLENVGQIFRVSDAGRIGRLFLTGITPYPPVANDSRPPHVAERARRMLAKTAIRTGDFVPWEHQESAAEVVRELRRAGAQVVALEQTNASTDYRTADYRFPVALVIGHERGGVSDEVLESTDLAVEIPMYGMGNSLNVAVAYGIVVYELLAKIGRGGVEFFGSE